ncbi:MAG TPA: allantoicase [Micromonosporaceae bacterium]|jgi:allantoicase|nr:allantoicase [Micromonosporaceae bacterium]
MTDFTALPDLASQRLGGGVVRANDEFFAAADCLVDPAPPVFQPNSFGPKGQVYDGWETRRRREPGHDHAIVRLGAPGVVRGVVIDTAYFTGNYPPYASVEGCGLEGYPSPAELASAPWFPLLSKVALAGDTRNAFTVDGEQRATHVRLSIYPDGGVARLRVHGEVVPDPRLLGVMPVDLAAMEHGGRVIQCSNMFYGSPNNLLLPGLAGTMGEGWETARRRDAGNDWVLIRLGVPGRLRLAELDTSHFKGNAPGHAALRAIDARVGGLDDANAWFDLLPRTRLQPDTRHRFVTPAAAEATHVRLDVYPDGGMARLRLFGVLAEAELAELAVRWFNLLPAAQALAALAGLTPHDAQRLVDSRPVPATDLPPQLWK